MILFTTKIQLPCPQQGAEVQYMEVSGQHHTPPALLLVPIKYEAGFVSKMDTLE